MLSGFLFEPAQMDHTVSFWPVVSNIAQFFNLLNTLTISEYIWDRLKPRIWIGDQNLKPQLTDWLTITVMYQNWWAHFGMFWGQRPIRSMLFVCCFVRHWRTDWPRRPWNHSGWRRRPWLGWLMGWVLRGKKRTCDKTTRIWILYRLCFQSTVVVFYMCLLHVIYIYCACAILKVYYFLHLYI